MDKVFKKILEGLEIFDTLYERHENVTNQSQKEKLENDLKKETKKLQRFREQVKNWQAANEIKDKNQLLEHRRLVEVAMEKYKVVEKGSKTKAYSDQSLAAADEPEIDNEAIEFVRQSLDTLQHQTEGLECEIEKLQPTKKGKKNIHNEEQKKELEELLSSHQWHTEKLEIVLRLLQNEILSVDDIMNLSDDITYYLDENKNPDFMFDDTIYDDLNLEAEQALINEIHVIPDDSTNNNTIPSSSGNTKESSPMPEQITRSRSTQPISNSTSRSNSIQASRSNSIPNQPTPPKSTSSSHIPLNSTKQDTHEKPPVIQSIGTSSTHQATVTTLKPAPVPALTSEIKWSSVVTAAKKKDPSPTLQNSINTNAMNAASVLEALKKQKPKDSTPIASSNGSATLHMSASASIVDTNNENGIDINGQATTTTTTINPPQNALNKTLIQPSLSTDSKVEIEKAESIAESNITSTSKTSLNSDPVLNSTLDSHTGSNVETPFPPVGASSITLSKGFTKSQSLAAATDGFRFLPPGIQSFILSISASKDVANSTYSPFQSINHTPNRTYPTGLKAIHLAESWNKIKTSKDLLAKISALDHDSLFFGYYYGKSSEERNSALQVLTQKGWKQQISGLDWYLPRSIVSKGDNWNIGDYAVFNVDKWNVSERRNVRIENSDLI
ncbi:hypothetical protein PMKS-000250 [Pichia membranifaciens]|uniref:General negative regulator of transcription subunit n=1 Tax=Pichia membranifaciens TaxID=4926 RepID=A0A1Q2YB80_9ASCO|nr:hypothetical protein PMKS-000250 [Pichia membranifaciens]